MAKTFSKKDYESGNGMLTSVWGPPLWHVLHTMSFNYPVKPTKEQKQQYYDYFISLQHVLPCKYCRDNYKRNITSGKVKITKGKFKNRSTLSKWVYELHEHINKQLGKKSGLTYTEIRNRYENFRARCLVDDKKSKYEKGCTVPLYGVKSKCQLNIVPKDTKCKTIKIDPKCKLKRKK